MKQKDKKVYIEIIRIICIFFVLYCHTGMDAALRIMGSGSLSSYAIGLVLRVLSMTCNIIFFMVSGALLLGKEETLLKVLKSRVLRFILIMILFSFIQMLWGSYYLGDAQCNISGFWNKIYTKPYITQYWFLYQYIGFLIMLPLLRILVKNMQVKHYFYTFAVYFLIKGVLPIIEDVAGMESFGLEIPVLAETCVITMLGYFVEHVYWEKINTGKGLFILQFVGLAAFLMHAFITAHNYKVYIITVENIGLLAVLGMVIYVDIKALFTKFTLPRWIQKIIVFLGNGVFGVYLLEPQVRTITHFIYDFLEPGVTWFLATIIWLSAAILLGSLIMNLLKGILGIFLNRTKNDFR